MQIGYAYGTSSYAKEQAQKFSDFLYTPTGIRLPIIQKSSVKLGIQITTSPDDQYIISMTPKKIEIAANTELIFYAFQTQVKKPGQPNCIICEDKPRFQWRGIMIDVCRHFFDVDTIKSIIDGMSHYKLNVLHFHLTEDSITTNLQRTNLMNISVE